MKQKNRVAIVNFDSGDWEGIYVNGILEYEGHSIPTHILLHIMVKYQAFDDEYDSYWIANTDGLEVSSPLPDKFEDIPKEWLE